MEKNRCPNFCIYVQIFEVRGQWVAEQDMRQMEFGKIYL
jgi:hypothetical protein